MAGLRALLADLGYAGVRTHLQSGNVLVDWGGRSADTVAQEVQAALGDRFGFDIPVIARTGPELAEVVAADPLGKGATDPTRYVVTFLAKSPANTLVTNMQKQDFGSEQFSVHGREVYQWCPGGQHESPMVKALGKAGITSTGTARNWRTVTRLAEMAAPPG